MSIAVHTAQPGEPVASVIETSPTWSQGTHILTFSPIIITSVTLDIPLTSPNLSFSTLQDCCEGGLQTKEFYLVNCCYFLTQPTKWRWEGLESRSKAEIQAL